MKHRRIAVFLLFATSLVPTPLHAQGCAQCRDNAAATSPATQRAYRNAIILLTLSASGLFVATVTLSRRNR
jgi:hypothetical protein